MPSRTPFCVPCGATVPSRVATTKAGWVVAECGCGLTRELTSADVIALRRADLVRSAVLPPAPPVARYERTAPPGAERMRALAHDMFQRGTIDGAQYEAALTRFG